MKQGYRSHENDIQNMAKLHSNRRIMWLLRNDYFRNIASLYVYILSPLMNTKSVDTFTYLIYW